MAKNPRSIFICSCEGTMPIDAEAVRRACPGTDVKAAHQLCRTELDRYRAEFADIAGHPLLVACTQESPLFSEIADAAGGAQPKFVNIRETAGWSSEAASSGPKIAALVAAASDDAPPVIPLVGLTSEGVILVYGRGVQAIEAAALLKDHLDVTVLIAGADDLPPPRVTEFPVLKGTIRSVTGHLGGFEIVVDGYAQSSPSSRATLLFGQSRDGVTSRCDIILDLSGGSPLFPAADLRDGYLAADPGNPAEVLRAALKARDLVGTFDKPRYIAFTPDLCAHSRSRITGCTRCLDLCPTGAITPAGDHVAIDALVCAGCGQCASSCPTGAASYAFPPVDALIQRLRTLLITYRDAGGERPIVLIHDGTHGTPLIDALARHGDGLPANVLPFAVNETTQIGIETIAAAFAYGASTLRFLLRGKPRHDLLGLTRTLAIGKPILEGLGFRGERIGTIETDDPDVLGESLRAIPAAEPTPRPASFLPIGSKRDVMFLALHELHRAAPQPTDVIGLPPSAPYGAVEINEAGCTLCLACVSACPTGALRDDPEHPRLRFVEDLCVQCGLCKGTCPEKVITLRPQIDFRAYTSHPRVLKEEEPFRCIRCDRPFGVKSTIERIAAKLEGKHWMYAGGNSSRLDLLKMCDDCRVIVTAEESFDPHGASPRPRARTTDDYLREREQER
jgi:ferredoxin